MSNSASAIAPEYTRRILSIDITVCFMPQFKRYLTTCHFTVVWYLLCFAGCNLKPKPGKEQKVWGETQLPGPAT